MNSELENKLETTKALEFLEISLPEVEYLVSLGLIETQISARPPVDPYSRSFKKKKAYSVNYLG